MIGPDTVTGSSQDLPFEDVESEPDQHIKLFRPNVLQSLFGKAVNEFLSDRLYLDAVDMGQEITTIQSFEGILGRLSSSIEALINAVEGMLSQVGICQGSKRGPEQASGWGIRHRSRRFSIDGQFNIGKITGLTVFDDTG